MATLLESGRDKSDGWRHGLEPQEGLYGPFVAPTLWCVTALEAAAAQGARVDRAGLDATIVQLRKAVGVSGGAYYFSTGRITTISAGRSCGLTWVLRRFGKGAEAEVGRGRGFILARLESVPHGHSSPLMVFAWGALLASALDAEFRAAYWKRHAATLLGARRPDGRFAMPAWKDLWFLDPTGEGPPRETPGANGQERAFGDSWASAWLLFAWQAGRGRCVVK
jgi:hypothetical protein